MGHDGEDMLKLVLPNQKILQGPALNISEDVNTISNPKSTTEVQCPITPPADKPRTKTAECESEVSLSSMDNIQNNKQNGSMTLNSTNVLTKQTPLTTGANLITHVELAPTDPPVSVYDINMADSATMDQQETEIRDKSGKQPIISALAETPSKGSNPNKRKKNTPIKDINTEVNNGILAPVSPSVAINKKSKVDTQIYKECSSDNDICNICLSDMTQSSLVCLICKQKVHYSCYDSSGNTPMSKEAYEELIMQKTCKWLCNGCNDTLEAGQHKIVMSHITEDSSTEDLEADQIAGAIHGAVKQALQEEITPLLTSFRASLEKSYADTVKSHNCQVKAPPTPATSSKGSTQSHKQIFSQENFSSSKHLLSPEKTVVISNIRDKAVMKTSSSMKCHFNSLSPFKRMKIDYILKDQFGNLLIQFPTETNAKFVIDNWEGRFLGENSSHGTKARPMNKQISRKPQSTCCIVKQVPHTFCGVQYDDEFIANELNRHLQIPCKVQRFVMNKNGKKIPLTTVKIDLVDENQYENAMINGVGIGDVHEKVEKLVERQKLKQ